MLNNIVETNEAEQRKPYQYPDVFRVKPRNTFRFLGTRLSVMESKTYTAIDAINKPNWESRGLVFIIDAEGDDPENPLGVLLDQHDYVVIDDDEVVQ